MQEKILLKLYKKGVGLQVYRNDLYAILPKEFELEDKLLDEIKNNKLHLIEYLNKIRSVTFIHPNKNNILLEFANNNKLSENVISFSQERMWMLHKLEGSLSNHISAILFLKGSIKYKLLELAFRNVIERHEILRTVYKNNNGEISIHTLAPESWKISRKGRVDTQNLELKLEKNLDESFNIEEDFPIRIFLNEFGSEETYLTFVVHHIAADGWSLNIIINEVLESYEAYLNGDDPKLPELKVQYRDFAKYQRSMETNPEWIQWKAYWQSQLQGCKPVRLNGASIINKKEFSTYTFSIQSEVRKKLADVAVSEGTTVFNLLLSAFKILIAKLSEKNDLCIGVPVAGRDSEVLEHLVGCFLNVLPIRSYYDGNLSYLEYNDQVNNALREGVFYQDFPFEKIVEAVNPSRDDSNMPFFRIMFNMINFSQNKIDIKGLEIEKLKMEMQTNHYDITLYANDGEENIECEMVYNSGMFSKSYISDMCDHLLNILTDITNNPKLKLSHIDQESFNQKTNFQNLLEDFFEE